MGKCQVKYEQLLNSATGICIRHMMFVDPKDVHIRWRLTNIYTSTSLPKNEATRKEKDWIVNVLMEHESKHAEVIFCVRLINVKLSLNGNKQNFELKNVRTGYNQGKFNVYWKHPNDFTQSIHL